MLMKKNICQMNPSQKRAYFSNTDYSKDSRDILQSGRGKCRSIMLKTFMRLNSTEISCNIVSSDYHDWVYTCKMPVRSVLVSKLEL